MAARKKKNKKNVGSFLNRKDPPALPISGVTADELEAIVPRLDPDLQLMLAMSTVGGDKDHAQDIFVAACSVMYVRSIEAAKKKLVEELNTYFFVDEMQDYVSECLEMNEELDEVLNAAQLMGFVINAPEIPEWLTIDNVKSK
jgi:hypothetical protein